MNDLFFKKINEKYIKENAIRFYKYDEHEKYRVQKNKFLISFLLTTLGLIILTYLGIYISKDNFEMYKVLDSEKEPFISFVIFFILGIVIFFMYLFITVIYKRLQLDTIYYYYTDDEKNIIEHKKLDLRNSKLIFNKQYLLPLNIKEGFFFLLSPDYFYSNRNKEQLIEFTRKIKYKYNEGEIIELIGENEHGLTNYDWLRISIERKFLVEWSNWSNVKRSIVYFFLVTILYIVQYVVDICSVENSNKDEHIIMYLILFISGMIIFRIISRSIEIIFAFYKDVVRVDSKSYLVKNFQNNYMEYQISTMGYINGFKSSLLRSQGRLSLAIHSLIEFFILFSAIYIILSTTISNFWGGESSEANPLNAILYSFSLGVFNVSFDSEFLLLQGFLHSLQLLTSCVLILLSVSHYLNGNNRMAVNSFEYSFYNTLNIVKLEKKREF